MQLPWIGVVAAKHDLAGPDLRHEMAYCFGREDQRIEIDLLEIFGRLLLQHHLRAAALRSDEARMVRTIGIRRQIAAAMRRDHPQTRKAIERSLEDQMRQRNCRAQRIGDGVGEPAIACQALVQFRNALRMDEEWYTELFGLRPDRMQFRI